MNTENIEKLQELIEGMLEDGANKADIINVLSPILDIKTDEEIENNKRLEALAEKSKRKREVAEIFNDGRKI